MENINSIYKLDQVQIKKITNEIGLRIFKLFAGLIATVYFVLFYKIPANIPLANAIVIMILIILFAIGFYGIFLKKTMRLFFIINEITLANDLLTIELVPFNLINKVRKSKFEFEKNNFSSNIRLEQTDLLSQLISLKDIEPYTLSICNKHFFLLGSASIKDEILDLK